MPTIWRSLSCPPRSSNVQSSNARYYGCKRLALVNNMAGCSQVATNGSGDPEPTALMKSVCLRCSRRSQEQGRISMVKYRNRRGKKRTNPNHLEVSLFQFDTCCFGRVRWCSVQRNDKPEWRYWREILCPHPGSVRPNFNKAELDRTTTWFGLVHFAFDFAVTIVQPMHRATGL